ncbi:DUF4142 domain-containing protein [Noviluteimonas gilva]|nr:DUF4142 domain-containing protein [Lysobacter gilvus]
MWLSLAAIAATSGCDRGKQDAYADRGTSAASTVAVSPSTIATASTIAPAAPGAATPGTAQLNPGDLSFLSAAARGNEAEIATTELGMSRGNAKNKQLSRMLNGDHVALRDEITSLAPTLGTPPTVEVAKELSDLQGEAFDARLLATYREQHEAAIAMFTSASTDTTLSESVRLLASDALPKLRSHLTAVQAAGAPE